MSVVKGDRVLIAEAPASPAVPKIAQCDSIWAAADAAAQKAQQADQGSDEESSASDPANAAWEKGDADYRACMAQRLPDDPSFPALLKQAQDLADGMAGK